MEQQKHYKYFEGILQLRNPNDEVINFIEEEFRRQKKPVISKEIKIKGGCDLYFLSRKFLSALGKKLKQKFPGVLKSSATLHTKSKTGEDLYRVTILFRLLNFKKGDIVKVANEDFEVITVMENQVMTKNKKSGEKKRFSLEAFEKYVR